MSADDRHNMPDSSAHTAPVQILMYHHVVPDRKLRTQRGLFCNARRFAQQMAYLARASVDVVSMDRVLEAMSGTAPLTRRSVVLTFDDGFQDFQDYAWPVIQAHGFPVTLYAIADKLGKTQDWGELPAYGDGRIMDANTLRVLADEGVDIGGHTATHPDLTRLSAAQLTREIPDAKKKLEDELGRAVRHFAYPYGDYNEAVRDCVCESGYMTAVTTVRGRANHARNNFEWPRIAVSTRDGRWRFPHKLFRRRYAHDRSGPESPSHDVT